MAELEKQPNNQEIKWGGKRDGSGRKIGVSNKFKIADKLDDEQRTELTNKAYELAIKGDSRMIAYLLDQLCGRAKQSVEVEGELLTRQLSDEQAEQILRRRNGSDNSNIEKGHS